MQFLHWEEAHVRSLICLCRSLRRVLQPSFARAGTSEYHAALREALAIPLDCTLVPLYASHRFLTLLAQGTSPRYASAHDTLHCGFDGHVT